MHDDTLVHASHCCIQHSCKYSDPDCPAVLRKVEQEVLCEDCDGEFLKFRKSLDSVVE